jgi:hypothetical protein
MVLSIGTIVDDLLDGLGNVLFHFQRLTKGRQRVLPFVFTVERLLLHHPSYYIIKNYGRRLAIIY